MTSTKRLTASATTHWNEDRGYTPTTFLISVTNRAAPATSAVVSMLFSDSEAERGRELTITLFAGTGAQAADDVAPAVREEWHQVAVAALFIVDGRMWLLDVAANESHGSADDAGALSPFLYHALVNAAIDAAIDDEIRLVYLPSRRYRSSSGALPYDLPQQWYGARLRRTRGQERHWRIDSASEGVVRLEPVSVDAPVNRCFGIVHSFEPQLGTLDEQNAHRALFDTVLRSARRHRVPLTLSLSWPLYQAVRPALAASGDHALALCCSHLPGGLLGRLPAIGAGKLIRGLQETAEIRVPRFAERTLQHFGIQWILESQPHEVPLAPEESARIVRYAVRAGDGQLTRRSVDDWLRESVQAPDAQPVCLLEFAAARAREWFPVYDQMLGALKAAAPLVSCEDLAARSNRLFVRSDTPQVSGCA